MFSSSLRFLWTPRRVLALAALSTAVAVGCRAVPGHDASSRRAPAEDGRKDRQTAALHAASVEPSDPLLRAESLRRRELAATERAAALARGLEDEDSLVRGVAVMSLFSEPPDPATCLVLADASPHSPEARLLLLAWAAGRVPTRLRAAGPAQPSAIPVCSWARTDADPAIRSRAAAICARGTPADESILMSLARDPEWQVRARLATALVSHRGEASAITVLNLLAHDPHATVRRAAMSVGPATS